MAGQTAAIDTSRKAAIVAEVLDVHTRLTGPAGEPIEQLSGSAALGLAPAAACYAIPEWARAARMGDTPTLWLWPSSTWASGPRPHELRLAAAFAIAAALDHLADQRTVKPRPTLALVRSDGTTSEPASRPQIVPPQQQLIASIEQRRSQLVDVDGVDPARSLRPRIDDHLALSAACYLLPAELRAPGRTAVPLMWALPDENWIEHPTRIDELIEGTALLLAAIEVVDVMTIYRSRPAPLAVIDGGAI